MTSNVLFYLSIHQHVKCYIPISRASSILALLISTPNNEAETDLSVCAPRLCLKNHCPDLHIQHPGHFLFYICLEQMEFLIYSCVF